MAAAAEPPCPTPGKLIPVHEDVQPFKYSTAFAALGGGSLGGGGASLAAPSLLPVALGQAGSGKQQQGQGDEDSAAQRPPLEEALEDFISLDVEPAAAPRGEQPPEPAAGGGGSSVAGALLDDYVSLGILEDPSAAAAKKAAAAAAAAAPRTSSRPEVLKAVPWGAPLKGIRSPLLRLHQEIVEFCRYLAPSPAEQAARQAAIDAIEDVVTSIWPKARVQVFGSFATGLYLPTSDVDAVIMGSGCGDVPQGLKALANALARRNMAKNMQVIAKAKVPIVKFEDAATGYNFDISFDVANGPEAAENVRTLMDSLPPMRPLVMVLKVFLQQRELNEVYSGGLGSYALLVMVAAFLQLHPSRQPPASAQRYGSSQTKSQAQELEGCLGLLLVDFLRLFGRALNNVEVGVSCRKGGSYFNKRAKGFFQVERPFLFAVEDPNDPDNDLGRNSYNISRVRMAFDWAYCQLTAPSDPGASLLQRIIRLDPVLFLRAPPPHPDDGPVPSSPPGLSKKEKRKRKKEKRMLKEGQSSGRRGSTEEEEEQGGQQRQAKRQKRRHRERSLSDSDEEGGGRGRASSGSPEHWRPDEEVAAEEEDGADSDMELGGSSAEEEEDYSEESGGRHAHQRRRRAHKGHHDKHHKQQHHHGSGGKHHHHHHHHSHHKQGHRGGGSSERRHQHHRHRHSSGGGSSRHVYFD